MIDRTMMEHPPEPPAEHHDDRFDPNRLFDVLRHRLGLEDDAALAHALHVEPYLIARIREKRAPLDPSLLIRINEATGINMRELRQMMGDRRAEYRLYDKPQTPPTPEREADKRDEGEERGKLRRSIESDDAGLPNFVQWS